MLGTIMDALDEIHIVHRGSVHLAGVVLLRQAYGGQPSPPVLRAGGSLLRPWPALGWPASRRLGEGWSGWSDSNCPAPRWKRLGLNGKRGPCFGLHTKLHTQGGWGWTPSPVRPDAEAPGVALVSLIGRNATVGRTRAGRVAGSKGLYAPLPAVRGSGGARAAGCGRAASAPAPGAPNLVYIAVQCGRQRGGERPCFG